MSQQILPNLILASTSPYRAILLSQLGIKFTPSAPDYMEAPNCNTEPAALAIQFAEGKARSLLNRYPHHIIVGSDQVATVNHNILSKPATKSNAIQQLLSCSNEMATFYTATTVINTESLRTQRACTKTKVTFRELSRQEIERYIDKENPVDCCGSFKIEGLGISLMRTVESDDPTALIGLPLITLSNMLRTEGFAIP